MSRLDNDPENVRGVTLRVRVVVEVVDDEDGARPATIGQEVEIQTDPLEPRNLLRGRLDGITIDLVGEMIEHIDRQVQRTAWGR